MTGAREVRGDGQGTPQETLAAGSREYSWCSAAALREKLRVGIRGMER